MKNEIIKLLIELPLGTYVDVVANQIIDVPVIGHAIANGVRCPKKEESEEHEKDNPLTK